MKKTLALAVLLAAAPSLAQDSRPEPRSTDVFVSLEDGTRFRAKMAGEPLVVRTAYGEQRIPFRDVRAIRRETDGEFLVHTGTVAIQGRLGLDRIEVESPVGVVSLPMTKLKALDVGRTTSIFADEHTTGLWSFEEGMIGDRVRERAIRMTDLEVQVDAEGRSALVRKSENGHAETPNDEDLKFASGDFTLEARVFIGSTSRSYVTILSKNDAANAQIRNYCLLVQNNGQMYWDSLSNGGVYYHTMTNTPVVALKEWAYLAVVVEPKSQRITFYVNGKQVHQVSVAFQIAANEGPLYFGASPSAHSWTGSPEKIQFVRLSKIARSADEIREAHESLQSGLLVTGGGGAARGVSLREGGFFASEFPSLRAATFRTKFGTLRLSEGAVGQLSVYRYRESELAEIQERVKTLIEKLDADAIDERETADAELLKIGAPAIPLLRAAIARAEEEGKARIQAILEKFEQTGVAKEPVADVFRMGQTVLHGWLEVDAVEIETAIGRHSIDLKKLSAIQLGPVKDEQPKVLRLKSGETIQGTSSADAALEVELEYGKLTIPFRDLTSLVYDDASKSWQIQTPRFRGASQLTNARVEIVTPSGTIAVPLSEVTEYGVPKIETTQSSKQQPVEDPRIKRFK